MRSRKLKYQFFQNEQLGMCEPLARLFFEGLWCVADCEGRLEDRPHKLRGLILPFDNVNGEELLAQLVAGGLVLRYQSPGQRLLWIPTFREHQRGFLQHEVASRLPPHPDDPSSVKENPGVITDKSVSNLALHSTLSALRSEEKLLQKKTSEEVCPEPAAAGRSEPPPLLLFPTVGKGPKEWGLTEQKVAEYRESFPGVEILAECRKARQWCIDNPTNRKTARGMSAFLTRWLGRVQNSSARNADQNRPAKKNPFSQEARQEVIDRWLQTDESTPPGPSTTPSVSDSPRPTPPS